MSAASRSRRRGLGIMVALVALFAIAPVAAQADPVYGGPPTPNKGTYLALGDSLAFGYQGYKVAGCASTGCTNPDSQFSTGYVTDFAGLFGATFPGVKTVNLGCPGETSATLISAKNATTGCTTYPFPIHSNHPGKSQLQAALKVLDEQGKKVNPVTLDIGANDVLAAVNGCKNSSTGAIDVSCVAQAAPATFATVQSNVDKILYQLRDEGGKSKEIIVSGLYNPLYVAILSQTGNPVIAAQTDQLTAQLNALLQQTATKYHAKFVNPLPTFNSAHWGDPAYYQLEAGTLCATTLMCPPPNTQPGNPGGDIHASDAGYAAYANLFLQASGY